MPDIDHVDVATDADGNPTEWRANQLPIAEPAPAPKDEPDDKAAAKPKAKAGEKEASDAAAPDAATGDGKNTSSRKS